MPNCLKCHKPLKSIGTSRKNGKPHADWDTREYHKCCWKIIKEQEANERYIKFITGRL